MILPDVMPSRVATAHKRHHFHRITPTECWACQRGYAMCLSKVTHPTREDAEQVAREINERQDYADPVMAYPCDWGSAEMPHWHVAHCKKPRDFKRARRAERRWRAAS